MNARWLHRVLGLQVWKEGNMLWWKDRELSSKYALSSHPNTVYFHSVERLVVYFLVGGWIRMTTAFIKRRVTTVKIGWDN